MVREVVLAIYDDANSITMRKLQAEAYGQEYIGEKLACSATGPVADAILKRGLIPVQVVEVREAILREGQVIGLCELLQVEAKQHRYWGKGSKK